MIGRSRRRRGRVASGREAGFTLVELVIAMALVLVIMAAFFLMFFSFGSSGTSSADLSEVQGSARNVIDVLEADLRSADPLVEVPASFAADPTAVPGDVVAMVELTDRYAPCPSATTTVATSLSSLSGLPSPYLSSSYVANVVWADDTSTRTLTRYSYADCNGVPGWYPDLVLRDVVDPPGTTFTLTSAGTQASASAASSVSGSSTPACATAVTVTLELRKPKASSAFRVRLVVPLPNQKAVEVQACT